jgi:peptide/nickel transport system ATP-binding protein
MGSIPSLGVRTERLTQIDGAMPRLTEIPTGCAFNPRCTERGGRCLVERPDLMAVGATRAACWQHDRGGVGPAIVREAVDA